MTNVFISYSRADKERVERIVAYIDSVVGEVWWDDRLVAGESFTDEVERRLNEADFVVVVWTPASARSKWVLDEAAVGRDAGKLLPVCLDGQIPPLGFRHVHSTDFSAWDGTPDDKCARALREALSRKPGEAVRAPTAAPAKSSRRSRRRLVAVAAAAAAAIAIAAVAAIQSGSWNPPWARASSIAVLPFADLGAEKGRAYFAEGIAEEIRSALARDPSLKVIGSMSSAKYAGGKFDIAEVRRVLDVEYVLEGSVRTAAGRVKVNVGLLRTDDGSRVWNEQYDRSEYDIFTIENEIGRAVARHLGATGKTFAVASTTSASALDLLLEARQLIRKRTGEDALKARGLLERAIGLDPASAAILGALSEAVYFTADADFFRDEREDPQKARKLAEKAIVLAPDRADGYAALSLILSDEPAAQRPILEKAVALDPSRSDLRMWLLSHETDPEKQIEGMRTIIALDPLWARPVENLALHLTDVGRHDQAERAIADYAARVPDDTNGPMVFRAEIADRRGDLAGAYKAYAGIRPQADTRFARAHALAILGMDDEAAALLPEMETPPEAWVRRDSAALFRLTNAIPRFVTGIPYEMLADHRRDDLVLQLYDAKLGDAGRFCAKISEFGVARGAPALVWALQKARRGDEAKQISACAEAEFGKGLASRTEAGLSYFYLAQLDALAGNRPGAMTKLRKATAAGYRGETYSLDFREYRGFDTLQDQADFLAIQARVDAEAARLRAEVSRFDRESQPGPGP
jgi:TolB-like protein